jgi:heterodisulfide reductase subunit C
MAHAAHILPGIMTRTEAELHQAFLDQVKAIPAGERIRRCIQCGTCTGSCPVSYAMDISPRQLIALFRAGELETIMKLCASCYACTTRCPSGIKITDIIYALKRTVMEKRYHSKAHQVQILANLFIENLLSYGRLHEGTLIRKYYMKTGFWKLFGYVPLVIRMIQTKRLAFFPTRIKAHQSLSRIIKKAQEIEIRHLPDKAEYSPGFVGYKGIGNLTLEPRKGGNA